MHTPVEIESASPVINTVIFENSSLASVKTTPITCDRVSELRQVSDIIMMSTGPNSSETTCENVVSETETVSAVQTRAQVKTEKKSIRPLKHSMIDMIDAFNLSPDEFFKLQEEDETIFEYWRLAAQFKIKDGILFRNYTSGSDDDVIEQIIVPVSLGEKVVLYAYKTTLSGHMGVHATYKK